MSNKNSYYSDRQKLEKTIQKTWTLIILDPIQASNSSKTSS